jgi:hypothetical protein
VLTFSTVARVLDISADEDFNGSDAFTFKAYDGIDYSE